MRRPISREKLDAIGSVPAGSGMTVEEFAGSARQRRKHPGGGLRPTPPAARAKFASEVANFMRSKEWRGATAGHLVALYCWCHGQVYRVAPGELDDSREFALAALHVKQFVDGEFRGDVLRAVEFLQWTWKREERQEKWRVENGKADGRRLGWRLQFSSRLVTDFRLEQARLEKMP